MRASKTFLVGGYVRDLMMARVHGVTAPTGDRDWVVIGATPESMLAEGFSQVGAHFPVFLHPETHEEYALARTEKRSGRGHTGFDVFYTPDVTLEDDLARRDLTINAMAMDGDRVIDPHAGMNDIQSRTLRHIGPSFSDDPLRVLRVARFYARFDDFTVAEETMALMVSMVEAGELKDLTAERIWKETEKALACRQPSRFFELLSECGALAVIYPELAALQGIPQPVNYHPELDTFVHTMMVVDQAAFMGGSLAVTTAALLHDLGKALSPPDMLPGHIGHEAAGLPLVNNFCDRLRVPGRVKELALAVTKYHLQCHRALEMRASKIVDLLSSIGAFRIDGRVDEFVLACKADARGRKGLENSAYPQADFLIRAFATAQEVQGRLFIDQGHPGGSELGEMIRKERIRRVAAVEK